ncbi:MAG: signal peptidase I [Desulfitobacteriia bacterium]
MKFAKSVFEWILIIVIAFILSLVIRHFFIDTRIVPTGSMLPTIQLNDRLIVDRFFYKFKPIERGDIVVFKAPDNSMEDKDLVKRVIGLPGETVEIKNGKVYINDRPLNEPYVEYQANYEYGPEKVPEGTYFMLGDFRSESKDSHIWGFLPEEKIIGKVWIRYWPLENIGKLKKPPQNYFEMEGE